MLYTDVISFFSSKEMSKNAKNWKKLLKLKNKILLSSEIIHKFHSNFQEKYNLQ